MCEWVFVWKTALLEPRQRKEQHSQMHFPMCAYLLKTHHVLAERTKTAAEYNAVWALRRQQTDEYTNQIQTNDRRRARPDRQGGGGANRCSQQRTHWWYSHNICARSNETDRKVSTAAQLYHSAHIWRAHRIIMTCFASMCVCVCSS